MGFANRKLRLFTEEQYLDFEEEALEKSEFFQGRIYAMAGGSPEHGEVSSNTIYALVKALQKQPCKVYSSDVRVKIANSTLYTYPDASVTCNKPELYLYKNTKTLMNPTLIVEVLSPTTEKYDRTGKFESYKSIPSFTNYLLISQDRAKVEHFVRQEDGTWSCTVSEGLDATVKIDSLECDLPLSEIYLKVSLSA